MKAKYIYGLIFFSVCSFQTSAQELLRWGIKFGLDIPSNQKDFTEVWTYKSTFNYNIGFQLRVGGRLYAHTGLDYHINKCKLNFIDSTTQLHSIELGYVSLPLQFGYHLVEGRNVSLRFLTGLQYRTLIRLTKNDIGLLKSNMQIHNMDLLAGLGLDLYSFTFDVGYRKSFQAIIPNSEHYRDMLTLSLGLIF